MNKFNKESDLLNKEDFNLTSYHYLLNDKDSLFNKAAFLEIKEGCNTILLTGHDNSMPGKSFFVFKKYSI